MSYSTDTPPSPAVYYHGTLLYRDEEVIGNAYGSYFATGDYAPPRFGAAVLDQSSDSSGSQPVHHSDWSGDHLPCPPSLPEATFPGYGLSKCNASVEYNMPLWSDQPLIDTS